MGSREILYGRELLQGSQPHKALSRGHGLRILPCRTKSDPPAGRPVQSTMGQSQLNRRQPISLDGPGFRLFRRHKGLSLSADAFLSSRNDGYVAGLDRLHQQSTHDECGLSLGLAAGRDAFLGEGDAEGRRAQQQATAGLLRPAEYVLVATRTERRLRFGRRARRPQPRLSQHRPLQRRVDEALQSLLWW